MSGGVLQVKSSRALSLRNSFVLMAAQTAALVQDPNQHSVYLRVNGNVTQDSQTQNRTHDHLLLLGRLQPPYYRYG